MAGDISTDLGGEPTWVPILEWMRRAGLRVLHVEVDFSGNFPAKAVWLEGAEPTVWIDIPAVVPARKDIVGWGLAFIRHVDAGLLALSRHFGAGPPPTVPRTEDEELLEASGTEPSPAPLSYTLLPEKMKPASRNRLWEEIDFFFAEGREAYGVRWRGLGEEERLALQAAGTREIQRWVNAAARAAVADEEGWDRQLQAFMLLGLGRAAYDAAVRNPKRHIDMWPENDGDWLQVVFEIP
ncbi:MAG: hypothetical protein QM713_16090 [Arachnia sp.]